MAFVPSAGSGTNATARTDRPPRTLGPRRVVARTVGANRERTRPRGAGETRDARGVTRGITREDIVAEVETENAEGSLAFADDRRRTGARATSLRPPRTEGVVFSRKLVAFGEPCRAECRQRSRPLRVCWRVIRLDRFPSRVTKKSRSNPHHRAIDNVDRATAPPHTLEGSTARAHSRRCARLCRTSSGPRPPALSSRKPSAPPPRPTRPPPRPRRFRTDSRPPWRPTRRPSVPRAGRRAPEAGCARRRTRARA